MKRRFNQALALLVSSGCILCASATSAQQPVQRLTRLPAFGKSLVSDEDSSALVVNPANLAFMPSAEFRWSSIYLGEEAQVSWQGHALAFALPLPLVPLGTGLRLDFVDPPRDGDLSQIRFGQDGNYQWLTWGIGLASDNSAIGASIQRSFSDAALPWGLTSWSLGVTLRPFDAVGLGFVAHDINGPRNQVGGSLDRSYDFGLAIRPLGSRAVELGLEAKLIDARGAFWVPRATLGIDVGPLGRLRGEFSVSDPVERAQQRAWIGAAALDFALNGPMDSIQVGAGSVFGNGIGTTASSRAYENIQTEFALRSWREPVGVDIPTYAIRIRIENTPSVRGQVALLRKLWAIAEKEPTISAVVLELRTSPGESFAAIQELRDAVFYLRERGKKVLCHLEDAGGGELYLCSAADRTLINPAGGVRFAGLHARYLYFKGLLDKLGIRADFVRVSDHKSAPEPFIRQGPSETARRDHIELLQQFERGFARGVAAGRHLQPEQLRERVAKGPFIATEAKAAGLVDGGAFDDELEAAVSNMLGSNVSLLDDNRVGRAPTHFGNARGVAIVYLNGDMVDGRSMTIPLVGITLAGSYTIAEALKQVRQNPRVGAVVLRIDSGGGSAMAADVIWREVKITAKEKPVIVSMAGAAASGGYYAAVPATRIFANPLTVTGSIGIFYGKADVTGLLAKLGITVEVYRTAPRADAESIFRPYTDDERRELEHKVDQFYDMFLGRVAEGRKVSKSSVDAVGRGRVWTGEQAYARKLVDELGGLRQAIAYARRIADLPEYGPIYELPKETTWIGQLLGIEGVHDGEARARSALPAQVWQLARALAPFTVYPGDTPLARIELVSVEP